MNFAFNDTPRDITGLEKLPPASSSPAVFLGLLAALAILGYFLYRWVAAPQSRRTPEELALHSLERLKSLRLIDKNKAEGHFSLLSSIARRYLDRRYRTSSRRQTTAEFIESARQIPALEAHLEFLIHFFEECDLARFAPPDSLKKTSRRLEGDLAAWLSVRDAHE